MIISILLNYIEKLLVIKPNSFGENISKIYIVYVYVLLVLNLCTQNNLDQWPYFYNRNIISWHKFTKCQRWFYDSLIKIPQIPS